MRGLPFWLWKEDFEKNSSEIVQDGRDGLKFFEIV